MVVGVEIHFCHNVIKVDSDTQSSLILQPIFARNLHNNIKPFPKLQVNKTKNIKEVSAGTRVHLGVSPLVLKLDEV